MVDRALDRQDLAGAIRLLAGEISATRSDVAEYRLEARSSRRLTWTVAGALLSVLGIVLAVTQSVAL